jgi:beta-phosphoglucomutase-like phosphatase (HAD superfamily)
VIEPQVNSPGFLFDRDGTLIDSVYQHVLAWQEALTAVGIELSVWRIHRRMGMSGGLFVTALMRETGGELSSDQVSALNQAHNDAYARRRDTVRPLPGACELLAKLTERQVKWAIATSGQAIAARPALEMLGEIFFGIITPPGQSTRHIHQRARPHRHHSLFIDAYNERCEPVTRTKTSHGLSCHHRCPAWLRTLDDRTRT